MTLAELGEKAEPITTAVTKGFTAIMEAILGLLENVDFEAITEGIETAFAYFIDTVLPAIVDGLKWIGDNWEFIAAGIAAVGAAFAAFQVVSLIQSVTGAIKGMSIAQAALNLVMSLNPIGLVVAAIAGLVAAFVTLWQNCDGFREFWQGLWEDIKSWCSAAWEAISGFFTDAWEWCVDAWEGAGEWFSGIWESISGAFDGISQWFSDTFGGAWEAVTGAWSDVKQWFSDKWTEIKEAFDVGEMLNIGKDMVAGIWDGISGSAQWLYDKLAGWVDSAVGWVADFLGIASPSKVMADRIGKNMALGVGVGYADTAGEVSKAIQRSTDSMIPEVGGGTSGRSGGLASGSAGAGGGIVINQTNNYSQAHSRYEIYKSKQETAAAVRLVMGSV